MLLKTVASRASRKLLLSTGVLSHVEPCFFATMSTKNFGDEEQRAADPSAHEQRFDQEREVKRNPHPDFSKVEASRPDWDVKNEWHFTKTKEPGWKLGHGANDGGESLKQNHVEIDPYEEGRPAVFNYKLLISAIIPRPIGFVSTRSEDGNTRPLQKGWTSLLL